MITLIQAIQNLVPGAEVSVGVYDQEITWINPTVAPVTLDEILAEQQRLQQNYDWHEYRRNRAREYPSVEEQLDALYHAGLFPPAMAERIRQVKEKYPPPQMSREEWLQRQVQTPSGPPVAPPAPAPVPLGMPTESISAEEWLRRQSSLPSMTREQWLAQQNSSVPMTREQWLASQSNM